MIGSRWKKIWADFWGNKSRAFLTVIIIMVGAFAVGFTSSMGQYLSDSMNQDYLSANPSEATISAYPLDDDMVEVARRVPGVEMAEAYSIISPNIIRPDGSLVTIQITALKDPNERRMNFLKPVGFLSGLVPTYDDHEIIRTR